MLRLMSYLHTLSLYPAARMIVTAQSEMQRFKTLGKKPKVHFQAPYNGQRIMLLALYEKGTLRPDVIRLISAAKEEGLYVLAVNTLKLTEPANLQDQIDCYIERPNFGRDFGSYKTGFLHVFAQGWHETCPRLLMINDSIFFSAARMPKFLNDMMTSEIEVLGATENYEIEYHLGSFCIAMAQSVLKSPNFQTYWKNYYLTDVRPRVIKRGEMKLSKTLKRCVSSPEQFRSLYSAARYASEISESRNLVDFSIKNGRMSNKTQWKRFSPKTITDLLRQRFISKINTSDEGVEVKIDSDLQALNLSLFVGNTENVLRYVKQNVVNDTDIDQNIVLDTLASELSMAFNEGSQIHQNASILIYMGLPIIKLDGMYRGMFNVYDILRISNLLVDQEKSELQQILFERPFGGDTLIGWRRAAFMVGMI